MIFRVVQVPRSSTGSSHISRSFIKSRSMGSGIVLSIGQWRGCRPARFSTFSTEESGYFFGACRFFLFGGFTDGYSAFIFLPGDKRVERSC